MEVERELLPLPLTLTVNEALTELDSPGVPEAEGVGDEEGDADGVTELLKLPESVFGALLVPVPVLDGVRCTLPEALVDREELRLLLTLPDHVPLEVPEAAAVSEAEGVTDADGETEGLTVGLALPVYDLDSVLVKEAALLPV